MSINVQNRSSGRLICCISTMWHMFIQVLPNLWKESVTETFMQVIIFFYISQSSFCECKVSQALEVEVGWQEWLKPWEPAQDWFIATCGCSMGDSQKRQPRHIWWQRVLLVPFTDQILQKPFETWCLKICLCKLPWILQRNKGQYINTGGASASHRYLKPWKRKSTVSAPSTLQN